VQYHETHKKKLARISDWNELVWPSLLQAWKCWALLLRRLLLCFWVVPVHPCWHRSEDLRALSQFKNNHRLLFPSSKHMTSANVFSNGTNPELIVSSCKENTLKGRAWNSR